jgi:hypothetical protein
MATVQTPKIIRQSAAYSPEWGSATIAYMRKPELFEYFRTYRPHGLVAQGVWVVANVMDAEGNKYNLFRQYKAFDTTMTVSSMVVPGLDSNPVQLFKPGEMFIGRCSQEMDTEKGFIEIKPFQANPKAFNIQVRPQHLLWKDADGRIDLEFKALGSALEFYCPGILEDDQYRSEPCQVSGTLNGQPVSGFGVIDAAWGPAGCDFNQSKVYKLLEEYWVIWMNRYEDGSMDYGVFLNGLDQFHAGFYNKNGEDHVARDSHLEVFYNEANFVKGAKFNLDDQQFEFTTEAKVVQVASMVSWASGKVLNLSEKRVPVQSFSWFEFFPKS